MPEEKTPLLEVRGKRKFIIAVLGVACPTGLMCLPYEALRLDASNYVWLIATVVGLYMGGNVAKAATDKIKFEYTNKKETTE